MGSRLVSLIVTLISSAPLSNVSVNVSVVSVEASAVTLKVIASVVPVTKFPVRLAPPMSALVTPVMVYATDVPADTAAVVSVTIKFSPSSTLFLFVPNTYVGVEGVVLVSATTKLYSRDEVIVPPN